MWNLFSRSKASEDPSKKGAMDHMLRALNESDAARPLPTLVCRACGLKYDNTGTYLRGSRCPACYPGG